MTGVVKMRPSWSKPHSSCIHWLKACTSTWEATGSSMKLTSMSEASVGKFTIASMCMRSISARRASGSVNSGMARMGRTISR